MATLIDHGWESIPPEKRPRIEDGKSFEEASNNSVVEAVDEDEFSDEEMPLEAFKEYSRQLKESEMFEVDDFSQYNMFNMVMPLPLDNYHCNKVAPYAKMAIKVFNQEKGKNYEFVRLVNVTHQLISGFDFYITFHAKDAAEAEPLTFQAMVVTWAARDMEDEVRFCRVKATKRQGTDHEQVGQGLASSSSVI